jgi:hypothetical protein
MKAIGSFAYMQCITDNLTDATFWLSSVKVDHSFESAALRNTKGSFDMVSQILGFVTTALGSVLNLINTILS